MSSLIFTTYILLIGVVLCRTQPLTRDESKITDVNIINGYYTNITSYPWTVSFLVEDDIWGAGVILNKNWILTSAFNCLWVDPSYISVRVGSTYWNHSGTVYKADKYIIHENYTGAYDYNIALLKVKGDIVLGSNTTKRISPPWGSHKPRGLSVSGWGVRSSSYEKESHLQCTNQTMIEDAECRRIYNFTSTTVFCAHNIQDVNSGPCVFDYGAPLVNYAHSQKRVFGIYSGSQDCTDPISWPAVYVDVYQFKSWIKATIKNNQHKAS